MVLPGLGDPVLLPVMLLRGDGEGDLVEGRGDLFLILDMFCLPLAVVPAVVDLGGLERFTVVALLTCSPFFLPPDVALQAGLVTCTPTEPFHPLLVDEVLEVLDCLEKDFCVCRGVVAGELLRLFGVLRLVALPRGEGEVLLTPGVGVVLLPDGGFVVLVAAPVLAGGVELLPLGIELLLPALFIDAGDPPRIGVVLRGGVPLGEAAPVVFFVLLCGTLDAAVLFGITEFCAPFGVTLLGGVMDLPGPP